MTLSRRTGFLVIAVLLSGLVLVSPFWIVITDSISGPCRFVAQKEWSVYQIDPDKLYWRLIDHDSSRVESFSLLFFNRPDYITVSLAPGINAGRPVRRGQTIAHYFSHDDHGQYADLAGLLDNARARLEFLRSGEKASVLAEAEKALAYAQQERLAFEPKLKRQRELYSGNLISEQELELSEDTARLLRINVDLQQARLRTVSTGEKVESLAVAEAEISRLQDQLDLMETKLAVERVSTPIPGIVLDQLGDSVLCSVSKDDTLVVQMPVHENRIFQVRKGQALQVSTSDRRLTLKAQVHSVGRKVQLVLDQPMYIVTALMPNTEYDIRPGMTGSCKIVLDRISLLRYLARTGAR